MNDEIDDTVRSVTLEALLAPTVLIVDDDDLVLARLKELVADTGFSVRTAASGTEALKLLDESPASIVITDLNMPGMSGFDLCRRIRARAWAEYVYVVVLTIRGDESDVLLGLDAGADDYLSKRTSAAHFTARLRTAQRILTLQHSLKSSLDKMRQHAMTDALTGVYNRRYFMRHLGRELKRSQRFGGDVALLLLDIDHFKLVNDTYGHVIGDIVLTQFTRLIAKCLQRATDWCARLGGDEFAVVLEGAQFGEARACAEKVRRTVANTPILTSAGSVRVTVSIGVGGLEGFANRNAANVHALLANVDGNLYACKLRGRNRVILLDANGAQVEIPEPVIEWSSHADEKIALSSVR